MVVVEDLGRPGVADFADIIKIVITLIKTTFISSIMVKKNKLCSKMQFLHAFLDATKIVNLRGKMLMSTELKVCLT